MKLYRINTVTGPRWHGTQADAKAEAKQLGTEFAQVDVPTDKPGLIAWLNAQMATDVQPETHQLDPLEAAELRAVAAAGASTTVPDHAERNWEATDIEAFILERATVAQASRIFECFGTRFKELANERG